MLKRFARAVAALLVLAILPAITPITSPAAQAQAQVAPTVQGPSAFFRDRLEALAQRYRVGFVIEGEPPVVSLQTITATLATTATAPVLDPPPEGCEAAVTRLAAVFDYSVRRRGALYLLRKKYTHPQEMPNITPGECRQAAAAIGVLLQSLAPPGMNEAGGAKDAFQSIRSGLTPGQREHLQGGGLVRFTEFSPSQRDAAQRFLMDTFLASMAGQARIVARDLDEKRQVRFTRDERGNPGYLLDRGGPEPGFHPLSRPRISGVGGTTIQETGKPQPERKEAPLSIPLREVVARLNARGQSAGSARGQSTASTTRFGVEGEFAEKPVTLIGQAATAPASPATVAAAVAEVYGLRVRRVSGASKQDVKDIITRIPVRMDGIGDSMAAVRRCLPVYVSHFEAMSLGYRQSVGPEGTKETAISFVFTDPATGATMPVLFFGGNAD